MIDKPLMGNFIKGIGNNDSDYSNGWISTQNDFYDWCYDIDGKSAYCICKNDCDIDTEIQLKTTFAINSSVSLGLIVNDMNNGYNIFYTINGMTKHIEIDENTMVNIPLGAELSIIIKIKNGQKGSVISTIKNLKCLTMHHTCIKIPIKSFMGMISTAVKNEMKK